MIKRYNFTLFVQEKHLNYIFFVRKVCCCHFPPSWKVLSFSRYSNGKMKPIFFKIITITKTILNCIIWYVETLYFCSIFISTASYLRSLHLMPNFAKMQGLGRKKRATQIHNKSKVTISYDKTGTFTVKPSIFHFDFDFSTKLDITIRILIFIFYYWLAGRGP